MLQMIPRLPKKVSVAELKSRLEERGYPTTLRTIQRDLPKLSAVFPLVTDGGNPAGWAFTREAPAFDIPTMDPAEAITLRLVEEHLERQMPKAVLKVLEPRFAQARAVLKALPKEGLPAWSEKVKVVPRGFPLLPPELDAGVLEAAYDAVLRDRVVAVRYLSRSQGKVVEAEVHPLGLLFRDSVGYLVGVFDGYEDVRQLALHRVEAMEVLGRKRKKPRGFSMTKYVEEGNADFVLGPRKKVVVRVAPDAAATLVETPLSREQVVTEEEDGWVRIEAEVVDSRALRALLLSFGDRLKLP